MDLQKIIDTLNLTILTEKKNFSSILPTGGYTSDLLSCVMAGGIRHGVWVTLQAHMNIIAVAALLEISAVIITEGAMPDEATIRKANLENIILLSTKEPSFAIVGKLWEMGIKAG